ncbi:MAG: helix-turn-helix transcriptional regulator [Ekhidna sp.]|uniref:helix-turn-helix domain-containing protein n=1 Tax=Ekhidna sp. TaxID=2608089 RepID=UPI0032EB2702
MENKQTLSDKEQIALRLKQARNQAGLSQDQAAALMKIPRPAISEIESAKRKVTLQEAIQFADIYRVDKSWLLLEDEDQDTVQEAQKKLAARELSKLDPEEFQKVMDLLKMIRK